MPRDQVRATPRNSALGAVADFLAQSYSPERKAPGYYDLALGVEGEGLPSQALNNEYIRHLLREGFAEGGAVHMDEGGAAFGVFPQMKARRAQQDRTAAANAPLSALRGWAAGTAGLAGDIEGLARAGISQLPPQLLTAFPALRAFGIGSRADPTPQLPTTEFYTEYLPGAQLNATPTGKAFTTAGNLLGGAGSTTLARYGIKSAKATAKAIAEAAPGPASGSRAAQLGVIKLPGGNFLKGEVEDSVSPMKARTMNEFELKNLAESQGVDVAERMRINQQPAEALNTFIDKKIAPYIRNEMATPDDPLRAMAEKYAVDKPVKLAEVQARIDDFAAKMEQTARDRGVPVEQLTSMRQQMIGLEKEKALVEAREGLHFNPDENAYSTPYITNRKKAGTDIQGIGQSPLARSWEDVSDSALSVNTAADILRYKDSFAPWLFKVPPETKVYRPRNTIEHTGFAHLVDELRNATNPESGLPKNLLIDPADLGKLTMPQAVDRVADINAWRATQRIEANQAIANNAATQVVKEYPEQGVKWVELNQPKAVLEEGHAPGPVSGYPDMHGIIDQRTGQSVSLGATPEEALGLYKRQERYKTLEDALKYEGDTMQHCVGGYCPDVAEGRSKIYSLRDAKGQPRVTIEVEPNQTPYPVSGEAFARLSPAEKAQFREHVMQWRRRNPDVEELTDKHTAQALREAGVPPQPDRITQIKGFRNKKPADEYLPMVQDFVKSGNWSEVNDLKNTGLSNVGDRYFTEPELVEAAKKYGRMGVQDTPWEVARQRHIDAGVPEEQALENWVEGFRDGRGRLDIPPEGMAHGGFVSNHFDPIKIKQIIAGLDDEYDPENIQQIIAQRESAYA